MNIRRPLGCRSHFDVEPQALANHFLEPGRRVIRGTKLSRFIDGDGAIAQLHRQLTHMIEPFLFGKHHPKTEPLRPGRQLGHGRCIVTEDA